jgi:hypothetical protein
VWKYEGVSKGCCDKEQAQNSEPNADALLTKRRLIKITHGRSYTTVNPLFASGKTQYPESILAKKAIVANDSVDVFASHAFEMMFVKSWLVR